MSHKVILVGGVGILLVTGISYAVWKASFPSHSPVKVAPLVAPEPEEAASEHVSDNFLHEEKARFKTKSGVEVVLSSYSECEACDAPEFLAVQTEADSKVNAIPSPQEHNFSETPEARLKSTVIYGACSDDIIVYQELNLGKSAGHGKEKPNDYTRYVATILPSGSIRIRKEPLKAATFEKLFKASAPSGCEAFHQDDVFAASY